MTYFFILVIRKTEPFVTLVFILRDQGAARNATFTNITRALLNFTLRLIYMIFKKSRLLKCLLQRSPGIGIPTDTHGGLIMQSLHF